MPSRRPERTWERRHRHRRHRKPDPPKKRPREARAVSWRHGNTRWARGFRGAADIDPRHGGSDSCASPRGHPPRLFGDDREPGKPLLPAIVRNRAMPARDPEPPLGALRSALRGRADLAIENVALRQQLANLRRTSSLAPIQPRPSQGDLTCLAFFGPVESRDQIGSGQLSGPGDQAAPSEDGRRIGTHQAAPRVTWSVREG